MTIGAYIGLGIVTLIVIGSCIGFGYAIDSKKGWIISSIIGLILCISIWCIGFWYYNNTESGKRALKTQESNLSGGIEREITVYDLNGEIIEQYSGKFDVDFDNTESGERVVFDDEDNLRHVIYPGGGVVIINEIKQ